MGMLMNVSVTGKECFSVTFMERGLALHSFLAEQKLRGPKEDRRGMSCARRGYSNPGFEMARDAAGGSRGRS